MTITLIKTAERAFPADGHPGMTLRDYFAAKAMPTFIALEDCSIWNAAHGVTAKKDKARMAADAAYHMADAMLAARGVE